MSEFATYATGETFWNGQPILARKCGECGEEVLLSTRDTTCDECGTWYNASGQRLRDDWMIPSTYAEYGEEW